MSTPLKATDAQILAAYEATGSVKVAGQALGMCGQSVHERLVKLGKNKPANVFTEQEVDYLRQHYAAFASIGRLDELASRMGRTKPFLCRQARALGLTDKDRGRPWCATWKYLPLEAAEVIWEDFRDSRLGLKAYCDKHGFDDLGFSKRMKHLFADEWDYVIELKQPKQSLYKLGRAFEYQTRDRMKTRGFFVTRSPGSRSPIDLVAIATGCVLFIQCKRHGILNPKEWNEIFDLARSCGAKPILARRPKGKDRGLELMELTARKDGSGSAQPMVPFDTDEAA